MTETSTQLVLLFAAVVGLLFLATVAGELLRLVKSEDSPVVDTFVTRVHSWWAMVAILALALISGRVAIVVLFAFCSFAALREFLTLTKKTRADHWAMVVSFYVILPVQYVLIWWGQEGFFTSFIPVYAFLLLPILSMLRGAGASFLHRISETQWALMICVFCASHVPALLVLEIDGFGDKNVLLIAFLVLVVQLGDLMEYFAGRRFGRVRVAPTISSKTWEGIGCGLLFAVAVGWSFAWITPFGVAWAGVLAGVSFLMGVGGALVLAAIKHDRGVRNWGHLIPGQGGFVDQLDSVFFAAPAFFYIVRYFWV